MDLPPRYGPMHRNSRPGKRSLNDRDSFPTGKSFFAVTAKRSGDTASRPKIDRALSRDLTPSSRCPSGFVFGASITTRSRYGSATSSQVVRHHTGERRGIDVPSRQDDRDFLAGEIAREPPDAGEARRSRALGEIVRRADEDADCFGDLRFAHRHE